MTCAIACHWLLTRVEFLTLVVGVTVVSTMRSDREMPLMYITARFEEQKGSIRWLSILVTTFYPPMILSTRLALVPANAKRMAPLADANESWSTERFCVRNIQMLTLELQV